MLVSLKLVISLFNFIKKPPSNYLILHRFVSKSFAGFFFKTAPFEIYLKFCVIASNFTTIFQKILFFTGTKNNYVKMRQYFFRRICCTQQEAALQGCSFKKVF